MRLVSYNILDGGVGRADPLTEVLAAQQADVVVLVEAGDAVVVDRIARRLKADVVTGMGRQHAIAVLSRLTIVQSVNYAAMGDAGPRCCIEAIIQTRTGRELPIVAVHFSAGALEIDEDRRQVELREVLSLTATYRSAGRPHFIVGDFNSEAPAQRFDISTAHPSTAEAFMKNGGSLPRRVVQTLLDAGYVDSFASRQPDSFTQAMTFTTLHPGQRVDYIFVYGIEPTAINAAWIESDRLAQFASDHYPVGIEVAL